MTNAATEPILVLDGQTVQALACVRSLGRAGHPIFVASRRRRPLAAWSRYCRESFRLSDETPGSFAILRAWAASRAIRVVLPLTERGCVLLNLERGIWEHQGTAIACASSEILDQAFDKARTLEAASACGVATPPTRLPASLDDARRMADEVGYPCVVKARYSNTWDGTTFLPDPGPGYAKNRDELETVVLERCQAGHWPIIQGFVPGVGKGVFTLYDHHRPVAWFAHERLRDVRPSGSGSSLRRAAPLEDRLRTPAERLLTELGWHGPAMVEFRDDGSTSPVLIEVNGRFWGSLQLAVAAGADFPRWWIDLILGRTVRGSTDFRPGVTVRWLWGDVKRLLYIAAGPPAGYPGRYPSRWQGLKEFFGPQPRGTKVETWDLRDPWPAVGEWVQGIAELIGDLRSRSASQQRPPEVRTAAPAAVGPADSPLGQPASPGSRSR